MCSTYISSERKPGRESLGGRIVVQSFGFKPSSLGLPAFIDGISPLFPQVQPQGVSG